MINDEIAENIFLFSKRGVNKVVVYSHGLTDGFDSDFANSVISDLYNQGLSVFAYNFDFFKKNEPSQDLQKEIKQLREVLEEISKRYLFDEVILIGKSLGGVVSLMACVDELFPVRVSQVFVLGFPIRLGFPPQIGLLNEKKPTLPDYAKEYKNLLSSVEGSIHIIQGDCDDLCDVDVCRQICKKYKNFNLHIVRNANHGFSSCIDSEKKYYEECSNYVVDNIIK